MKNIELDRRKLRGKLECSVRENLREHIMSARYNLSEVDGKKFVTLRVPKLYSPRFEYEPDKTEIWHGEGEIGKRLVYQTPDLWLGDIADPLQSRRHLNEKKRFGNTKKVPHQKVEFELEKLIDLVREELCLPSSRPSRNRNNLSQDDSYSTISKQGLTRHFRRSFLEALKKNISSGNYQPGDPNVIREQDWWKISPKRKEKPDQNATVIYLKGQASKYLLGTEVFWLNLILERQYKEALGRDFKGIKKRYVLYSNFSAEVSLDDFLNIKLDEKPLTNAGYKRVQEIINEEREEGVENIYVFHYSNGAIYDGEDVLIVPAINRIMKSVNVFAYTQIRDRNREIALGPNAGLRGFLKERFSDDIGMGNIFLPYIRNKGRKKKTFGEDIMRSIKAKLITGR